MTEAESTAASPIVGRYRLMRALGEGATATVYLAYDSVVDREVALKLLREDLSYSVAQDRFVREIRFMGRLQHPHILPILDCGDWCGRLFYVMPVVRGESLEQRLHRQRQLPLDDVLRLAREVCDALAHAHTHQIIHRDVKPGNIYRS